VQDFATHNVALLLLLRPKHVSSLDAGCEYRGLKLLVYEALSY
jgi:hypothetical protein